MIIDININELGYAVVNIVNNGKSKYGTLTELKENLNKITIEKVRIIDGNILIKSSKFSLNIKNYKNNKEEILKSIIEEAIEIKIRERKKELRNKKIKRAAVITSAVIIVSSIILPPIIDFFKDKSTEEIPIKVIKCEKITNEEYEEENGKLYINHFLINFNEDRTDTDKFEKTKRDYYNIIERISNEYGIDPQIMLAIATQESGKHLINNNESPALGLMQLEKKVWLNNEIEAYNYVTKTKEKIYITEEKMLDLETNIRIACMYFQQCLKNSNYNIPFAIQMYNFGYGNMEEVLKAYLNNNNATIINDIDYIEWDWSDYRYVVNEGDLEYLEKVISYLEDTEKVVCKKGEKDTVQFQIMDKSNEKTLI